MALNITMHGKIGGDIIDLHPKTDVSQVEGLNSATTVSTEFLNKVSTSSPLAKIKKISGKSVAVNQLTPELTSSNVTIEAGATASITNGVLTMTAPISTGIIFNNTEGTFVVGHVFYLSVDAYASTTGAYRIGGYSDSGIQYEHTVTSSELNTWVSSSSIQTATSNTNGLMINSGSEDFGECKYRNNMLLDLTLIFGTGNEPTTVDNLKSAWLTKFGYPLPTYIPYNSGSIVDCDIKGIGATGRNLVNPTMATTTKNGVTCTNNGDGTYTLNGTSTAATSFDFVENGAIVLPSGSYQIIGYPDGNANGYMRAYIKDYGELLKGQTATLTGSHSVDRVAVIIVSGKTFNNVIIKPMLTADLTATYATFEPYSPYYRSFPIILRSAGNVKDTVEDTGNGYKVTRRVGSVDLGSLGWVSSVTVSSDVYRMCTSYTLSNIKLPSDSSVVANALCAKYETTSSNTAGTYGCHRGLSVAANGKVYVYDENYNTSSSATSFKTAMNGVMLNYELATPTTEYHSYNLTYPVTLNGTEYFDSPISVPCEIEYGVDALTDIASGVVNSPTDLDRASVYASNPNLLDNGWFTVNQREATSGTTTSTIVYLSDRWSAQYCTYNVNSDKTISVTSSNTSYGGLYQVIEVERAGFGNTVTVSVLIDGMLGTTTLTTPSVAGTEVTQTLTGTNCSVRYRLNLSGIAFQISIQPNDTSTHVFKAVKLELGSVSTLANDNAPDTKLETAKCMLATADGNDIYSNGKLITATTTVPTAAINVPKMAILSSEPATKYDGWIYFITD